jgi:hypothetical protein
MRALLPGMAWIDVHHRNTSQACPLPTTNPDPVANPLQRFAGNAASGALRRAHQRSGDAVIDLLLIARLLACELAELPACRFGAVPLQIPAAMGIRPPLIRLAGWGGNVAGRLHSLAR